MNQKLKIVVYFAVCCLSLLLMEAYSEEKGEFEHLPQLKGHIHTFYSEGYKERAEVLQSWMEEMLEFYHDQLDIETNIQLVVLDQDDWPGGGYGMPRIGISEQVSIVFMPATSGGVVYESALNIKDKVSEEKLQKLKEKGYTYEEAANTFVDLIALHELGHYLASVYGIESPTSWLNELLATYISYAFLQAKKPDMKYIWDEIATNIYVNHVDPTYTSLEDFEELYIHVGAHNYCWYQAMFNKRVSEICQQQGIEFIKKMKENFPAISDESPNLTSDDLLEKLEKMAPGFKEWAQNNFK